MDRGLRRFRPGEKILIREILRGKVWTVRPVTVVEDTDEHLVSYLAPGTLIDYPVGVEHGERCFSTWLSGDWELHKKVFLPPGVLRIAPAEETFEVFASIRPEGGVSSWYVNFQEPLRRTSQGFDTMDETIDLLVSADFSSWQRRDEDELELATSMGVYDRAHERRLRDNCVRVEKSLGAGIVPWSRRWHDWAPQALPIP